MPKVLIVADDLTGANDTGVMMARQGLSACTVLNAAGGKPGGPESNGCLAVTTESRAVASGEAYRRVFEATRRFGTPETGLYSKRIDSTLRGNPGAEIDAMADALGGERLAVIVPAFPGAGRCCVGGHILVNGVPLLRTAAARDPRTPVSASSAAGVIGRQSARRLAGLTLDDLPGGPSAVARLLRELYAGGARGVVCDAVGNDDIDVIARAALESGLPFFAADPGAFTSSVAALRFPAQAAQRILFAVGTANDVAAEQTARLLQTPGVGHVILDTALVLESQAKREEEAGRVLREAERLLAEYGVCCICVAGVFPGRRVSLQAYAERHNAAEDEMAALLNDTLAQVVARALKAVPGCKGLFACGGDVAAAICRDISADGILLLDEVMPLAVYGQACGGPYDGLHLVTKGGMVGGRDAMTECLSFLRRKLREQAHRGG